MKTLSREKTVPHKMRYRLYDPAMVVDPGETIVVETINHMTPVVRGQEDLHAHGSPQYREREETGPIFVRGAVPGDMLAVHIRDIQVVGIPHAHGSGPFVEKYPQKPVCFPVEDGRCLFPGGWSVPMSPMVGDIYTTPASPEARFFDHGGNMDFTGIKPGNTLYLPVFREGGLLVMGDVHAAQGDGELFGEAAECAADVTVTIDIDRRFRHPRPIVETPTEIFCLAGRGGFSDSVALATEDMTGLLSRIHGMEPAEAYMLCTVVGSVRNAACVCYNGKWLTDRSLIAFGIPKDITRCRSRSTSSVPRSGLPSA